MDQGSEKKLLTPITSTSEVGSSGKSNPFTNDKASIGNLYTECWFCESGKPNIVNVLDADDKSIDQMRSLGLMNFDPGSDNDNVIGLCGDCSSAMKDKTSPGIIFIPYSLQYFIEFEKADQRRRLGTGQNSRVCPGAGDYESSLPTTQFRNRPKFSQGGVYSRYLLRASGSDGSGVSTIGKYPGKEWHGAPITAIKRAWLANGTLLRANIPPEISNQLDELLNLYLERVGPIASSRVSQQGPSGQHDPGDQKGADHEQKDTESKDQGSSDKPNAKTRIQKKLSFFKKRSG